MYQHLNEDGTPYIFSRGVDYYMPVSPTRAPPSELLSITGSNETAAYVDFSVMFLLIQPLTTTLDLIPGVAMLRLGGRLEI
jgi:hypothetical protein